MARARLRAVTGLAELANGKYQQAANAFLKVNTAFQTACVERSQCAGDIRSFEL